jgi:hypothetical protein
MVKYTYNLEMQSKQTTDLLLLSQSQNIELRASVERQRGRCDIQI